MLFFCEVYSGGWSKQVGIDTEYTNDLTVRSKENDPIQYRRDPPIMIVSSEKISIIKMIDAILQQVLLNII